ncbi:TRAP transporter substrate-binding protein [Virgibacillus sp. C22-A2]|uniref:TRAP transporter substrate-binding protein n=1 Tax=Virgibacillus tibetensis TaxID=3042313 RepID=A0ABU6KE91_9BACI|nr:TRAP transporter substrate-binding protein [Virgibacillus sp. C22-A2]
MKKMINVLFLLSVLIVSACSENTGAESNVVLQVGHVYPADSIPDKVIQEFNKIITEKTDGRITADIYPAGQMGDDPELQEAVQLGSTDIIITGSSLIDNFAPEYGIVGAPYVFRDWDHIDKALNGELGEEMNQAVLDNSGVQIIGISQRGARNLTANEEIKTPSDMEGFKLRTPNNEQQLAVWGEIGANPTPLDWGEVYTSLQQGVIAGQENPLDLIHSANLAEVQDYLMITQHLVNPYWYAMNNERLQSLSEEDRKIVLEAMDEATAMGTSEGIASEEELLQLLEDAGMTIVEPDVEAFQIAAQEGHKILLEDGVNIEFYEKLINLQ